MGTDKLKTIRGMRDILPADSGWWQRMERQLAAELARFGYREIRTPILEQTALFARSIGQETDIVSKEMYTFEDRDGSLLSLRPEGTAAVVRAVIEHNLARAEPVQRLYYQGPMFRHERPQKGRYRQFHQVGAELFGTAEPAADVELIDLMVACMAAIGLDDTALQLNSLGCGVCRPPYRRALVDYLSGHREALCADCRRRLESNPLRVLDCKQPGCQTVAERAPHMLDHLCTGCRRHFDAVRRGLDALSHPYQLDHRMVRGLDYYNRTTFELLAEGLGAQNAVAAGGRYDGLVAELGGPELPAVGFAAGLDRILLLLHERLAAPAADPLVFVVTRGESAWLQALELMQRLRRAGLRVSCDVRQGSLKSQMKRADKDGARWVLLLGEDELALKAVTIKDMAAAAEAAEKQASVALDEVDAYLLQRATDPGEKGA
jgi:histidyl-tRNA synthetase